MRKVAPPPPYSLLCFLLLRQLKLGTASLLGSDKAKGWEGALRHFFLSFANSTRGWSPPGCQPPLRVSRI